MKARDFQLARLALIRDEAERDTAALLFRAALGEKVPYDEYAELQGRFDGLCAALEGYRTAREEQS
ncbi:MAG TPA: hypothetical protein VH575_14460 [Gemmataceae bacterium]